MFQLLNNFINSELVRVGEDFTRQGKHTYTCLFNANSEFVNFQ